MRLFLVTALLVAGCVVPDVSIEGRPCPCPEDQGFVCDDASQTCVAKQGAGGNGPTTPSSSPSTGGNGSTSTAPPTCNDVCGTAGCGDCPTVAMVDAGGFMIDSTEVTNAQYKAFLDVGVTPPVVPTVCDWNTDFLPHHVTQDGCDDYDFSKPSLPITCVDWCDAAAYCKWAGKRLCGRIGGGSVKDVDLDDATKSQWFAACTKGGTQDYPYSDTYDPLACNSDDNSSGEVVAVGINADCEGGYDGIFDMVGNAEEWEDACDISASPESDNCPIRGGAFWSQPEPDKDYAKCVSHTDGQLDRAPDRNETSHDWSFRCCSD